MKRCIDCKHFSNGGLMAFIISPLRRIYAKCLHPKARHEIDRAHHLITGGEPQSRFIQFFCTTMRESFGDCGPEAKLFEAKQTRLRVIRRAS